MASVTINLYDKFRENQISGAASVDLTDVDVYCMIVKSAYTPNQNTHETLSDVGANEVSGTGYTSGGILLENPTVDTDVSGNVSVDFDDPAPLEHEPDSGFDDGDRLVFYADLGGSPGDNPLIGYSASMGGVGNKNGQFSIALHADGLIYSPR